MKHIPKIKGVSKFWGKWVARLNGKYLGRYETQAEAKAAREKAIFKAGVLGNMASKSGLQDYLNTKSLGK
jgi:hypothetical protein